MATSNAESMDFFEKVGYSFGLWNESWEAFKLNVWTFVVLYLVPIGLTILLVTFYLLPLAASAADKTALAAGTAIIAVILTLLTIFVSIVFYPALIITQLESVKGNKISFSEAFNGGLNYVLRFIIAGLIGFVIVGGPIIISLLLMFVLIGFVLLPFALLWAVVATFFLFLTPYIIITQNLDAVSAIKKSYETTRRKWQWVLALYTITALLSIVSSVPVIGGLAGLVGTIIFFCLPAIIYLRHITPAEKAPASSTQKSKASPKKPKRKATTKKSA